MVPDHGGLVYESAWSSVAVLPREIRRARSMAAEIVAGAVVPADEELVRVVVARSKRRRIVAAGMHEEPDVGAGLLIRAEPGIDKLLAGGVRVFHGLVTVREPGGDAEECRLRLAVEGPDAGESDRAFADAVVVGPG